MQKRSGLDTPTVDPVMSPVTSPDFGSPPQRSHDIFVLLAGSNCCGHLLLARIPAQRLVSRGLKRAKSVFQSNCYYVPLYRLFSVTSFSHAKKNTVKSCHPVGGGGYRPNSRPDVQLCLCLYFNARYRIVIEDERSSSSLE